DTPASTVHAPLTLATLDPHTLANGVWQVRLTAWDLQGRTRELEARLIIDSIDKAPAQATVTDALYTLGGHDLALTRRLTAQASSRTDFGNWRFPLLDTGLTSDQPTILESGITAPWSEGARVWLTVPESLSVANAGMLSLAFTLGTASERLGADAAATLVWRPVFTNSQGWTLEAHASAEGERGDTLTRQGSRLYNQITGLPWVPAVYTLTAPDGTHYSLNAQGQIQGIEFTDGAQWFVSDAGIAASDVSGNPAERLDLIRDSQGRIARITGVQQGQSFAESTLYRYDEKDRLVLVRELNAMGNGMPYGYDTNDQLLTDTLIANLGAPASWLAGSGAWSGEVTGQATLGLTIRDSEIASTVKVPGAQGALILAITLTEGMTLDCVGGQVLGSSQNSGTRTTLMRITESGLKLLRITGSGPAEVSVSVAGDLNHDGAIDGADAALWQAAASDVNGDGLANANDRQILFANTGYRANRAPTAGTLPTLKTHTDLANSTTLAGIAEDSEGDTVFWQILGATHGSARFSADGQHLIFKPEAGYVGEAKITVQADDGYTASAPMELTVNVSGAKLLNLHLERIAVLATGGSNSLRITGDFEDQQGVALDTDYVHFQSDDPATVALDARGHVLGKKTGITLVTYSSHGIIGANAIQVAEQPRAPVTDEFGNELDLFPNSLSLAAGIGQRQIDVHAIINAWTSGTNLTGQADLQYFVSDATVASVSADGLIKAKATGLATITVIQGARQGSIELRVVQPVVGPLEVTAAQGGVTQDSDGNTLMIGAGVLPADVTASINSVDLDTLGMRPPAQGVLQTLGAVLIDIGGLKISQPMQLALKVTGEALEAGTKVLFWRRGEITLADGTTEQTWWLVDDGVIGDDGLAHTASPPYSGPLVDGCYALTSAPKIDADTGDFSVDGHVINVDAIYGRQAQIALATTVGALAGGWGGAAMAYIAGQAIYSSQEITAFAYNFAGTYQRTVPASAVTPDFFRDFPAAPIPEGDTRPAITSMRYDPDTLSLKLTVNNALPEGQAPGNFVWEVWLEPRGSQLTDYTYSMPVHGLLWQRFDTTLQADGSLQVVLPAGVALSQHIVSVTRRILVPDGSGVRQPGAAQASEAIEAWTDGTDKSIAVTRDGIKIYVPSAAGSVGPIAFVADLKKDERGNTLELAEGSSQGVAYSEDGTLAYVAGRLGRIYVVDLMINKVVETVQMKEVGGAINALAVSGDWLYVAKGSGLSRICVDQLSTNFHEIEQSIILPGYESVFNFVGLAINNDSYLGVTAFQATGASAGFVAFVDLNQIRADGKVAPTAVAVVDGTRYPRSGMGKTPVYLASGPESGQFVLCNRGDLDRGLVAITLKFDDSGQINAATTMDIQSALLSGNVPNTYRGYDAAAERSIWDRMKTYHEDIQAASGAVVVKYDGQEYAIVSDFNLWFNDPLVSQNLNDVPHTQIGGKVGVIQNPFGRNGQPPVYLGATTPIVGSAVRRLSLAADGTLYADVWNYEPNLDAQAPMSFSLYTWNAPRLIQGALADYARDSQRTYPLDRDLPSDPYSSQPAPLNPELIPNRYDDIGNGETFKGWINLGNYQEPGMSPAFGKTAVRAPKIVISPKEPVVSLTAGLDGLGYYVVGGINLLTGGYMERADQRMFKYHNDQLSYDQMVYDDLIDFAATSGAFVISGGVATGVAIRLTEKGFNTFAALSGAGAAMGYTFDMVEQAGANLIYIASDGADGREGLDFASLALATLGGAATGGVFAVAGQAFGWLANKVLAKTAARAAETRSGSLDHDNLPEITGKAEVSVGDLLKFTTPSARTMTLEEVERWFQAEMAKLGTMVDANLSLKLQVEEAYALKEQLLAGAKVALKYPGDIDLFGSWHSTPPLERLKSELAREFSGDELYTQLLKKITALDEVERIVMRGDGFKTIRRTDLQAVCFDGETKVIVENGEHEEIQYIDVGQMVLSRCEKTGEMAYRKVIRNIYRESVPTYEIFMHGHNKEGDYYVSAPIIATAEHPFWVKGKGWVPLSALQAGDALESCRNIEVLVKEVRLFNRQSCVYNLEVEGFNTFFLAQNGVWVHNCNDTKTKVWELLPQMGSTARVLENALLDGVSVTPNRAVLEDQLAVEVVPKKKIVLRSTLAELDFTNALRRAGKDSTYLPAVDLDQTVTAAEAMRNRLGKLTDPNQPWDFTTNPVRGNPDILVDGGIIIDIYTPWLHEDGTRALKGVLVTKSTKQASAVGIRLTEATAPKTSVADIIRFAENAYKLADDSATLPPGLRDLYILDQNDRLFHVKFPSTPENTPVYGQIDLATGKTFRLDRQPAPGQTFLNRPADQKVDTQGSALGIAPLAQDDIVTVLATARQYWIDAGMPSALPVDLSVGIGTLPVGVAAETLGHQITLSVDGAGWGWYADSTPSLQEEFLPTAHPTDFIAALGSAAEGKLDLLTVLIHELGHVAGLGHASSESEAMSQVVSPGTRRLPSAGDLATLQMRLAVPPSVDLAAQTHEAPVRMVLRTPLPSSAAHDMAQYEIVANPTLDNPQFDGALGWTTTGEVSFADGAATLTESATSQTRLNQVFVLGQYDHTLSFTVVNASLGDQVGGPDDAFEVALIDANSGHSLLSGTGLTHSDAIINRQANGSEHD
uniref:polymorphic toxin-type HINT domain-containing protein n=1 Tax=Propionivibrio sp. TaxID=2212460 RepID=UPI00262BDF4C